MKKLGKDLVRGDVLERYGLLLEVVLDPKGDEHKFWGGQPFVRFVEWHDPYMGSCSASLDPEEEFEIINDKRDEFIKRASGDILENVEHLFSVIYEMMEIKKENNNEHNDK